MKTSRIFIAPLLVLTMFLTACGGGAEVTDDLGLEEVDFSDKVLSDFLNDDMMDADIVCFQSAPVHTSELEVTTYISGDKIRLEYMMIPPLQGQSDLYMVSDGEYMYMWGDSFLGNTFQGFKIPVGGDDSYAVPSEDIPEMVDFNMPMIDCTEWDVDSSYFIVPDDVEFMDMGALEESLTQDLSGGGLGMDCSICDMMPEDQKQECLDGLGC